MKTWVKLLIMLGVLSLLSTITGMVFIKSGSGVMVWAITYISAFIFLALTGFAVMTLIFKRLFPGTEFNKLHPDQLNPKAREAHAHLMLNVSGAFFKSFFFILLILPATHYMQLAFGQIQTNANSIDTRLATLMYFVYLTILLLMAGAMRMEGLRHLHEMEAHAPDLPNGRK